MVCGVIAEFNIFHNGHKYLIDEAKRRYDAVAAVMSGCFVQRGDVAVTDKWSRARAAVLNGVDLVLELPVCYALNAAQSFAAGGVNTLGALGITDALMFGSESGDITELTKAAELGANESEAVSARIKSHLAEGMSYPSAVTRAYDGSIGTDFITLPNNILAVEYIKALKKYGSHMKPITVKRHGSQHDGDGTDSGFASASKIRGMLFEGRDVTEFVPQGSCDGICLYDISRLDTAFASRLRQMTADELQNVSEVSEGLENRILRAAAENDGFFSIAESVKSKRYTMSRIRRTLIASLIGFTKDIYSPYPEYIRVLGMTAKGAELLKKAKKHCLVPIITKAADFKEKSRQFELDIRASDIASLCAADSAIRKSGSDFTHSPVIVKGGHHFI